MNTQQSVFELWNYSFLFMTLSTLTIFTIDMLGHKTKTISSNLFSVSILISILLGELIVSFMPIENLNIRLATSVFVILVLSTLMPLKFRTTDPVSKRRVPRTIS